MSGLCDQVLIESVEEEAPPMLPSSHPATTPQQASWKDGPAVVLWRRLSGSELCRRAWLPYHPYPNSANPGHIQTLARPLFPHRHPSCRPPTSTSCLPRVLISKLRVSGLLVSGAAFNPPALATAAVRGIPNGRSTASGQRPRWSAIT